MSFTDYREKVTEVLHRLDTSANFSCQDGYTLETLDIYGIVDGHEQVNIGGVSKRTLCS